MIQKCGKLADLGSWTFMAKIVEIYKMCRFNVVNVREHLWTAINHFAWVVVSSNPILGTRQLRLVYRLDQMISAV